MGDNPWLQANGPADDATGFRGTYLVGRVERDGRSPGHQRGRMFRLGDAGRTEWDVNGAADAALQFKVGRS